VALAVAQFGIIAMGLVDTAIVGRISVVDLAAWRLDARLRLQRRSLCMV